jgi:hypothetical protein
MVYERFDNEGKPCSNNYNLDYSDETNVEPHFYHRLPGVKLYSANDLPPSCFLYELNWDYAKTQLGFFDQVLAAGNIRESILDRIRNKTAFIVLTVLHEGWLNDQFLSIMKASFIAAGIPLTQVIYVSNCLNGDQVYRDHCKRHDLLPEISNKYCPTFRIDKTDIENIDKKRRYDSGARKKTFLCFNRRFSDHRLLFYILVDRENLLDQFYFSMSKDQPESSSNFLNNAIYLAQRYPSFEITQADIHSSDSKLPLVLDNRDFDRYPMEKNVESIQHFYDDSLINIVTETYFFNSIIHITEKTYKPIAFMQPFIMMAAPYSLRHIKDMGFKTFDEFWDESYDTELDHIERMRKIFYTVKLISQWSESMKIQFSHRVADILKYNSLHLQSIKNIEMLQFVEKYGVL